MSLLPGEACWLGIWVCCAARGHEGSKRMLSIRLQNITPLFISPIISFSNAITTSAEFYSHALQSWKFKPMFNPQWTGVWEVLISAWKLICFNLISIIYNQSFDAAFHHSGIVGALSHFLVRAHFDLTTHANSPVLCLQYCSWNKTPGSSAEVTGFPDVHVRLAIYGWTARLLCRSSISSKSSCWLNICTWSHHKRLHPHPAAVESSTVQDKGGLSDYLSSCEFLGCVILGCDICVGSCTCLKFVHHENPAFNRKL